MTKTQQPGHFESAQIAAVVEVKLQELDAIPHGIETGRRLEIGGQALESTRDYLRRAFTDIGKRVGIDVLERTPAVMLDQLAIMSAMKNHDTAGLLKSLSNSFMIAYVTPETSERAYAHLVGLEALRGEVQQRRDGQLREALADRLATLTDVAPTRH
jgi:hypothetical protein